MKKLEKILNDLEKKLTTLNRVIFNLRLKRRRKGLTEEERRAFVSAKIARIRVKKQIKGLKEKLGVK